MRKQLFTNLACLCLASALNASPAHHGAQPTIQLSDQLTVDKAFITTYEPKLLALAKEAQATFASLPKHKHNEFIIENFFYWHDVKDNVHTQLKSGKHFNDSWYRALNKSLEQLDIKHISYESKSGAVTASIKSGDKFLHFVLTGSRWKILF